MISPTFDGRGESSTGSLLVYRLLKAASVSVGSAVISPSEEIGSCCAALPVASWQHPMPLLLLLFVPKLDQLDVP